MARLLADIDDSFCDDWTFFRVLGYDCVSLAVAKEAREAFFCFRRNTHNPFFPDPKKPTKYPNIAVLAVFIAAHWKDLGVQASELHYSRYLSDIAKETYGETDSVKALEDTNHSPKDDEWMYDPDLHRLVHVISDAEDNNFTCEIDPEYIHVHYFVTPHDIIGDHYATFRKIIARKTHNVCVEMMSETFLRTCSDTAKRSGSIFSGPEDAVYGEATIVSPHLLKMMNMNSNVDFRFAIDTTTQGIRQVVFNTAFTSDATLALSILDSTIAVVTPTRPRAAVIEFSAFSDNYRDLKHSFIAEDMKEIVSSASPMDARIRRTLLFHSSKDAAKELKDIQRSVFAYYIKRYAAFFDLLHASGVEIPRGLDIYELNSFGLVDIVHSLHCYVRIDDPPYVHADDFIEDVPVLHNLS
jgi:hypothetical protein